MLSIHPVCFQFQCLVSVKTLLINTYNSLQFSISCVCSLKPVCVKCLHLLLSRKDVARSPADVTVTGGDSSFNMRTPRGELSFALPAGVTFEQGSCVPTPAGESCGEELHFRLRISVAKNTDEGNVQDNDGNTSRHVQPPSVC